MEECRGPAESSRESVWAWVCSPTANQLRPPPSPAFDRSYPPFFISQLLRVQHTSTEAIHGLFISPYLDIWLVRNDEGFQEELRTLPAFNWVEGARELLSLRSTKLTRILSLIAPRQEDRQSGPASRTDHRRPHQIVQTSRGPVTAIRIFVLLGRDFSNRRSSSSSTGWQTPASARQYCGCRSKWRLHRSTQHLGRHRLSTLHSRLRPVWRQAFHGL